MTKWTVDRMKTYVSENDGYTMYPISTDTNTSKVCFECPHGHQYMSTFKNFHNGYRCPKCWEIKKHKIKKSKGLRMSINN